MRYSTAFTFSQHFSLLLKYKVDDLIPYGISDLYKTDVDEIAATLPTHPNDLSINVNCHRLIESQDHFKFQDIAQRKILLGRKLHSTPAE